MIEPPLQVSNINDSTNDYKFWKKSLAIFGEPLNWNQVEFSIPTTLQSLIIDVCKMLPIQKTLQI